MPSCELAYPGIEFSRRSRNWWAKLKGTPPECVHLEADVAWIASLLPDTLYVQGKRSPTRESVRPEVSLCRECLVEAVESEIAAYRGNVVAFEPDPGNFSQYFFIGVPDFERTGLKPEVGKAIEHRLRGTEETCAACSRHATWVWFSRDQVASLDEVECIREASGTRLCSTHGAEKLCRSLTGIPSANLFYMNLPYGQAGAYVWI